MLGPSYPPHTFQRADGKFVELDDTYTGVLDDRRIIKLCEEKEMITPYVPHQVRVKDGEKVVSYGVTSYGYDVTFAPEYKLFTNLHTAVLDPKAIEDNEKGWVDKTGSEIIIPGNSFILARTNEYFKIPIDVVGLVFGKSTYARLGINCIATPLEPGWEGHLVLEFANSSSVPVKMYANEGCAQILFFRGMPCMIDYSMRKGKYQGQTGITVARI